MSHSDNLSELEWVAAAERTRPMCSNGALSAERVGLHHDVGSPSGRWGGPKHLRTGGQRQTRTHALPWRRRYS